MKNESRPTIGVAISGGGVRAALFSLGSILYLWKSGLHKQVRVITSVSGGSITNAVLAACGDFTEVREEDSDFQDKLQRYASSLASQGSFFLPSGRRFALACLGLLVFPAYIIVMELLSNQEPNWRLVALTGGGYVFTMIVFFLFSILLGRRSSQQEIYSRLLATVTTAEKSRLGRAFKLHRRMQLHALPESRVMHILCATELNSGRPIYMSPKWIYSPAYGAGEPRVPLSSAVYASAGFPAAFPPLRLQTEPLELGGGGDVVEDAPKQFLLADGGVFNNLGTDWFRQSLRASGGLFRWDRRFPLPPDVDCQMIINASSPPRVARLPLHWPFRNILAFTRIVTVLYENTVRPRIQMLLKAPTDSGLLLEISESPLDLARRILPESVDNDARTRTEAMIDDLERSVSRGYWGEFIGKTSMIKTTLRAIGAPASARLIRHGYMMATVACHAKFGSADLDSVPDEKWFFDLVRDLDGRQLRPIQTGLTAS